MADGNVPSRRTDLRDLLYQAQNTFARIHERASDFSYTLDRSSAQLKDFILESKPSGAIRRMDELNTESEAILRTTQDLAETSRAALQDLQKQISQFDFLDAKTKQTLVQTYVAKAAEFEEKAALFRHASDHLEEKGHYLSKKAGQLDDYLTGAGDDLHSIAKLTTQAQHQADDAATSVRSAGNWIDQLDPWEKNRLLNPNGSLEPSEEAAEIFAAAKKENDRLKEEIESTEQKLRQQHQELLDRMTEENMADPETKRKLENDQTELESVMTAVAGWRDRAESEAMEIRRLERKGDLGEFETRIAETTLQDATRSRASFEQYTPEIERVFEAIRAPLPSSVDQIEEIQPPEESEQKQPEPPLQKPPVTPPPVVPPPPEPPPLDIVDSSASTAEPEISSEEQRGVHEALQKLRDERLKNTVAPSTEKSSFDVVDETASTHQESGPLSKEESSQIEDALAALKKNRVQPPVTTTQDTVAKETPPETKKEEPSQPDSAAIASAIQDTLGRIPSEEKTMDASIETSGRKTPRTTTSEKQKTISETRSELRKTHAVQQHETEILKLYGERMRTRSLEYLQTHDSARYTQIQQAQARLGTTTTIDATVFLQTSELQAVHLLALTDVRATFSDATDELLSRLLLAQAAQQIATAGIASQGAQILAGQAATATLGAATMGTLAATGLATAGLASAILTKADQTRQALQQEEENLGKRASQLRAASRSTTTANTDARAGTPNLATLRAEQQAGSNTRRHLQADLHRQMQSATMANGLNDIVTTRGPGATSASQQEAAAGVLDLLSERVGEPRPGTFSRSGGGSSFGKKESFSSSEGARKTASGSTRKEAADASTSDASRAAHEASLASRLQAGKLRDQRIAEIEQTEVGSSRSMGGSSSGGTSDQLISSQGTRRRPASSTEVFAQKQQAMTARSQAFLGVGATAGGFEAAFGDASVDDRDQVIEVQDDDLLPLEEAASEQAVTEEQRAAEFQAEQQRDRQSNQNAQNKQSALDTLQKGKNLLDKKTIAQNSKFLLNPYVIAGIVVVLFFWLNIRLFFSNEESSWRQPLSGWGKIGTVVFDLALILSFLISFLLMASTVLLPLLPALLAIGGVSATISNITH